MVILDSFSYFFKEFFELVLLFVLIGLLTSIRSKFFYFMLAILSFPLTLLAVTDALLTGIILVLLLILLRLPAWKKTPTQRVDDLLGILSSLAIYGIVPLVSSLILTSMFKLQFNVLTLQGTLVATAMIGLDWVLATGIVLLLKYKVLNHSFSLEEKKIYTIQLGMFIAFVYLFAEILRRMQVLGVFRMVMVGFLIAQFTFTIFLTYLSIKKNRERTELKNLKEQMAMMNAYTADIEKNSQELRKFRHDYKNMLLGLKVTQSDAEINREYLKEMLAYSHQIIDTSVMRFSGISNLGIESAKSLVITKLLQAEQAGIQVNFECLVPINEINLEEVNLIRILGILFDNAIEASVASQAKKINVLFIDSGDFIEISIENSYKGKLPSLDAINQTGYSSKGKGRGLGLANVQDILSVNKQVELMHYAAEGVFVSTLTIRKSEYYDITDYSLR